MKVGLIARCLDGKMGGLNRYALSLFESLVSNGQISCDLIHHGSQKITPFQEKERIVPLFPSPALRRSLSLLNLRNSEYDLFHFVIHETTPFFILLDKPVVMTIHGLDPFVLPERLREPQRTVHRVGQIIFSPLPFFRSKAVSAFITVSEFEKREIAQVLRIREDKIFVAYNGVDLSVFQPTCDRQAAQEAVTRQFGIRCPYLLHISHRQPKKNVVRLIQAFDLTLTTHKELRDCSLVIAGKSWFGEEEVDAAIQSSPFSKNVIKLGPQYEDANTVQLYQAADAFLFPSLYESFGIPLVESMACGTAVLTSSVSAIPEIVGEAAICVDPYSVEEISEAMGVLLNDAALRRDLVQKGLQRAQQFTWQACAKKHIQVYEEALAHGA